MRLLLKNRHFFSGKYYERMNRSRPYREAFTLVEMLVIIAIVATLAILLMPVFKNSLDKAREAECMSRMRQVGMGFLAFAGENNMRLPVQKDNAQHNAPYNSSGSWSGQIAPYVGNNYKIMGCPVSLSPPDKLPYVSYQYNSYVSTANNPNSVPKLEYITLLQSKYPSRDVLLIDSPSLGPAGIATQTMTAVLHYQWAYSHPYNKNLATVEASSKRSILFVDGHVEMRIGVNGVPDNLYWWWPYRTTLGY